MAATRPIRVRDLIHKYGWDINPYLSALGIKNLAEAQVLFVDSGATNALDADDGYHGHDLINPLATWDYANSLCTASEGSIILLAPSHNENLGNAQIDLDVVGVHTMGMGHGALRPRIDFGHANSSINIGANDVSIQGVDFLPAITDVLIGVDVESGVTNFRMLDCGFLEGEDGSNVDEFIVCVDLKSANHDALIKKNVFRSQVSAAGCTTGIMLTAASSRVRIEDNLAVGNFSTAFIDDGAACSAIYIVGNTMKVADGEPGIELTSTTTGIIADNKIESTGLAVDAMIVAADCSWFNNLGVTADGSSAEIIGAGESNAAVIAANPNAAFAEVYWVDADSGSDSNDGLSPGAAFETIAAAIAVNNTAFGLDSDPIRTMYIHSKTYTENLTTWPENCIMIGIGGKVRIQGYHTISHTQNLKIYNIQFRSNQASVPILDVTGNCHSFTLDGCVFDSQATISECIKFTGSQSDVVINNNRIGYETSVANSPDIAIRFAGVHAQRSEVTNNRIWTTGTGIQIDITMVSGNFLLVENNKIAVGPGSSSDQAAIGIYDKTTAPRGGLYVNNYISAVDAIKFDVPGTLAQNLCIGNHIVQAGTGAIETSGS